MSHIKVVRHEYLKKLLLNHPNKHLCIFVYIYTFILKNCTSACEIKFKIL